MMRISLLCLLALFTGCQWNNFFRRPNITPTPIAFQESPALEQIVRTLNDNTARVQRLQSQGATLTVPGAPGISADLAMERPKNFRFRASTAITGSELDLGSNSELFWFWARLAPQSSLYFARHEQFASSKARNFLAIDPSWLMEGIGLPELPSNAQLEGPVPAGPDRIEIRGRMQTPSGEIVKSIVLHSKFAWVLEQRVYDGRGQLLAASRTGNHQYYPAESIALPQRIEVQVPSAQLQFQLDVDRYLVNVLQGDPQSLFALPQQQLGNYPLVDIADPNFSPAGPAFPATTPQGPPPGAAANVPPPPVTAPLPNYRATRLPETSNPPRYRGMPQRK